MMPGSAFKSPATSSGCPTHTTLASAQPATAHQQGQVYQNPPQNPDNRTPQRSELLPPSPVGKVTLITQPNLKNSPNSGVTEEGAERGKPHKQQLQSKAEQSSKKLPHACTLCLWREKKHKRRERHSAVQCDTLSVSAGCLAAREKTAGNVSRGGSWRCVKSVTVSVVSVSAQLVVEDVNVCRT